MLPFDNSTSELLVIGASIQLLTSGSYIILVAKSYIQSTKELTLKLIFQKSVGAVKKIRMHSSSWMFVDYSCVKNFDSLFSIAHYLACRK